MVRPWSPPTGIDYDPADPDSILQHARRLNEQRVNQVRSALSEMRIAVLRGASRKPAVGNLVEAWFGLPPSSASEPDFPLCGVELKTIPLIPRRAHRAVKEPTSIQMIDYFRLIEEDWKTASVRKKLRNILFVIWEVDGQVFENSRFVDSTLWSPSSVDYEIFRKDWQITRDTIDAGLAHELSERQARVLAARRKGARGSMKPQPRSPLMAKSRAFALKVAFTTQIVNSHLRRVRYESLAEILAESDPDLLESNVLARLHLMEGRTLEAIAADLGIAAKGGKSLAASIMKKSLGFKHVNSRMEEFERHGIGVKVPPIRASDFMPFEAVSFPAIQLREFADEDWEGSSLMEDVQRILFIPTLDHERSTRQQQRVLGHAFFWSPTEAEWEIIEREWRMYQKEVRAGKAAKEFVPTLAGGRRPTTGLTKESQTQIIHMRPHGRDATDTDMDPRGNVTTKQSFWLNKRFVQSLVYENRGKRV